MMRKTPLLVLGCVGAGAILTTSSDALASGFATARFGGEHGHPTTDNPTAIYYNPAGIAEDTPGFEKKFWRVKIFADANLALRWASWSHQTSEFDVPEPAGAEGANSGTGELFNAVTAPMAAATVQIENFAFGAAFFVPFGGQSVYDKNEKFQDNPNFAGPVDGVQRWHSIEGIIRSMYISVAAAYDILDRVSIGASLNIVKSDVDTIRARTANSTNSIDLPAEGRSWIDVGGWHASFGVGVIGEVAPEKVWIGASYQARPGLGQMELTGTLNNNFPDPAVADSKTVQNVKLIQELPDVFRMGVRARPIETVEIRVFGDVTTWGVFKSQCIIPETADECLVDDSTGASLPDAGSNAPLVNIVRNWGTAFGVRAGGSYWVIPEVEVFLGAGYDSNAIPDETLEVALTDFHDVSVSGGLRLAFGEIFAAALSYTHLFYVPRDTTGQSIHPTLDAPSKTPDSGGEYTQTLGVINANVQVSF